MICVKRTNNHKNLTIWLNVMSLSKTVAATRNNTLFSQKKKGTQKKLETTSLITSSQESISKS